MLRTYVKLKKGPSGLVLESYLSAPHGGWNDLGLMGRKVMSRIRCGCNSLRVNTGRWDGEEIDERLCLMCGVAVETEQHFLLECNFYQQERENLFSQLDALVAADVDEKRIAVFTISRLSPSDQLFFLTGGLHKSIKGVRVRRRLQAKILVEVAKWMAARERHVESMRQ